MNARNKVGDTALHAAAGGDAGAIESLLAAGAGSDVNARQKDGYTPLHIAAMSGASSGLVHAIEALVSAGADVNAKAKNGITPLHEAAQYSTWNAGAIETLISAGADVNARESDGYTPLHVAVMFDFIGVFVHVIEALVGARVAARTSSCP